MKTKNMTTLLLGNSISQPPLWRGVLLVPLALTCFALWPAPQAFGVSPAPDGGYTGQNTAEGTDALLKLTTGIGNTAIGFHALYCNTTGNGDTANGARALQSNTTGEGNTATGVQALWMNTTADGNTATGESALQNNTTGRENTATGRNALNWNTTGDHNTANGPYALEFNDTGVYNTATGAFALYSNITGSYNIALGVFAGYYLSGGDQNIDIGNGGDPSDAGIIRIGTVGTQRATFVAGIYDGPPASAGIAVYVNSNGQLATRTSSARFKQDIHSMDKASEAVLALQPVTFRYKHELDPDGIPQFGLVAEQVEKVNPDLVARDAKGEPYTVRYEAVNAMLLNEFLKEHRKVEQQEATITQLMSGAAKQEATITQLKSTVAQQQKGMEVFAATLKEQASQSRK
jgi:hypothetical protein